MDPSFVRTDYSDNYQEKTDRDGYNRTLPNLVNVLDHANLNFNMVPKHDKTQNKTLNRIQEQLNRSVSLVEEAGSSIKMRIDIEKMRNTTYWEKGTSAAHFVKDSDNSRQSKDGKAINFENSTGTKYFATSKWNSSINNTRYNEDLKQEIDKKESIA